MKRFILSFALLYIGLAVTAGNRVEIFTPGIPVVTGRGYGIVTEICIESDGRADTLERIDLAVADLDPALLRSARLVYTGTLSAIRSRTTSYVLRDQGKRLGGGQTLCVAGINLNVISTPGHTSGGVSYLADDCLFTGDTLFRESVGRTDLPTGSSSALINSIKKLYALPGDYKVYCGHEEDTTLSHERENNPFVRG